MIAHLTLEKKDKTLPLAFFFNRMVNAGFVGRNQQEVQKHVKELAAKGIPAPATTPVVYPVTCRSLTTDSSIEVFGPQTSGEVEYVLLVENEKNVYVGLGSDHTDRRLEETDIARSKQICPNIISATVWPLAEVEKHWDSLTIKSSVTAEDREIVYQEGKLELIFSPAQLMEFVKSKVVGPLDNTIIYSGTIGMKTDGFVFARRFRASLADPVLGRRLDLAYDVVPLDYLADQNS